MDDTSDKLRRNVIALSAAIVAIAFLNLSFKPSATLLGFVDVGNLAAWKVWLCLLIALFYMFLRYRFDAATKRELADAQREVEGLVRDLTERTAAWEVKRHIAGKGSWFRLLHPASLTQFSEQKFRGQSCGALVRVRTRARTREASGQIPRLPWLAPMTVYVQRVYTNNDIPGQKSLGEELSGDCSIRASSLHRGAIWMAACVRAAYGKGAVDVAVPFGLAALAILVCAYKLTSVFLL